MILPGILLLLIGVPRGSVVSGQELASEIEQLQRQLQAQQARIERLESQTPAAEDSLEIRRLSPVTEDLPEDLPEDSDESAESTAQPEAQPSDTTDAETEAAESLAGLTTLAERVAELENNTLDLRGAQNKFQEAFSRASSRVLNGRLHVDHWSYPQSDQGINLLENGDPDLDPLNEVVFRRVRFGLYGDVPPENVSYRVEIEFSGQDGGRIRDAWLAWDELFVFDTLRLGNQKRPYGLDYLNSSNFMVFLERPFVVEAFNENVRRFGLISYGASDDQSINWRYGVAALEPIQSTGQVFNERPQPELMGRLANAWWYDESSLGRGYGHWGISAVFAFPDGEAPNDGKSDNTAQFRTRPEAPTQSRWLDTGTIAGTQAFQILGLESVINVGNWQITGEFMNLWLQRSDDAGRDLFLHGGYVFISYFLTGEHLPWNRELGILGRVQPLEDFFLVSTCRNQAGFGRGAWQVAMRFSYADLTDADVLGGIGQSATLALNWYWNSHSRVQLNYTVGRIDDRLASNDPDAAVVSGDYQLLGTRFMIDF